MMEIDDKPEESTIVSPTGQGIRKSILGPKRDRSPTCHSPDSNSDSVALDHDSVNLGSEFKSPTSYNLSPLGKENEVLSVLLGPHQKIETCKERVVLSPRSQNWVTLAEQTIQTPRPMPSPAHTLSPDAKEWTPWQNDSCKKSTDSLQEQARSPKDGTAKIELVEDPWIPYCKTSLTPDVKSIGNLSALGKNVSRHSLQVDKAEDNLPSVKGSLDSVYREFLHKEDAGTEPTLLKHLKERKHAIPSQVVKCLTAEELGLTDAAFKTQGSEFKGPLIGAWLPWQHKKSSVPDTDFEPSENQNSSKNHSSPKWQRSCAPTRPAEPQYPFHKEMNTSAENKAEDLKAYFAQLSSEQDTSSDISMPQKSVADESRTRRAYQLPSKVCIYDLRGEIAVLEQPSLHSHTPPTFRGWDQESTSTQPPFDPNYEHPYELRTGDAKKQKSSFRGFQTLIGEPHSSNPGRNHSHSRPNGFDPYFSSAEYISAEEYNQRPSAQIGEQASVRADKYNQPTSAYMPKFKPDETFGPPSGGFMQSHSAPNLQAAFDGQSVVSDNSINRYRSSGSAMTTSSGSRHASSRHSSVRQRRISVLDSEKDVDKMESLCHIMNVKGQTKKVPRRCVDIMVDHQIHAGVPMHAPWYQTRTEEAVMREKINREIAKERGIEAVVVPVDSKPRGTGAFIPKPLKHKDLKQLAKKDKLEQL